MRAQKFTLAVIKFLSHAFKVDVIYRYIDSTCSIRPTLAANENETRNEMWSRRYGIKGNQPSRISFLLPEDKGDPACPDFYF